jgi:hypothetical protein
MTKAERADLARVIRGREKLAKTAATQRAAALRADFEKQLASIYDYNDDAVWKEIVRTATTLINDARAQAAARLAERGEALGIPARFAPEFHANVKWYGRGENLLAGRRTELRNVAVSRIAALEKATHVAIERQALEIQTRLLAGGLSSPEARAFLESLPSADAHAPGGARRTGGGPRASKGDHVMSDDERTGNPWQPLGPNWVEFPPEWSDAINPEELNACSSETEFCQRLIQAVVRYELAHDPELTELSSSADSAKRTEADAKARDRVLRRAKAWLAHTRPDIDLRRLFSDDDTAWIRAQLLADDRYPPEWREAIAAVFPECERVSKIEFHELLIKAVIRSEVARDPALTTLASSADPAKRAYAERKADDRLRRRLAAWAAQKHPELYRKVRDAGGPTS